MVLDGAALRPRVSGVAIIDAAISGLGGDVGELVRQVVADATRPDRKFALSDWAQEFRTLQSKTSSEPGPWRNARTPYLVEIMDCLSRDALCAEVVVMAGTQVGKTECGNNWIGYIIHQAPSPAMVIMPTLSLAKRFSKHRLSPMVEAMDVLRERVAERRTRDSSNTTLLKDFPDGMLVIAGANSAADLRSMPCRYIFADEIDGYPPDVDGEGDPLTLAAKRSTTFSDRKIFKTSTPTTKGFSRIESAFLATDRRYFHVPCPHCGQFQRLLWGNLRWRENEPESAVYVCSSCQADISEHHKTEMLSRGAWIAEQPGDGRAIGFHLSTLYSPLGWESWANLVRQFLDANRALEAGDASKMKTFVNTCLAETWEEKGEQIRQDSIQSRAEDYALRTVPAGGLVLTAAVDVQGNRLEYMILAWGRFEESWVVDYASIYGDPAQVGAGSVWERLETIVSAPLECANGAKLGIAAVAIDSGGHHTHEVYQWVRGRQAARERTLAVKGASVPGRPILGKPTLQDISFKGKRIKRGVQLWAIGTEKAKELIYGRLRVPQPGPGFVHFPRELPGEFYEQLTSERLVTRYSKGRPRLEWVKPSGRRNEALDLAVYATAAAHFLGIHTRKAPDWDRLEARLAPKAGDMESAGTTATEPDADQAPADVAKVPTWAQRERRLSGFVKGWRDG